MLINAQQWEKEEAETKKISQKVVPRAAAGYARQLKTPHCGLLLFHHQFLTAKNRE